MTADGKHVLVVGAGLIGCSAAYHLSLAGARVTVADRDPQPSATTRASLGVLTHPSGGDDPLSSFYRDSHRRHESLAAQLRDEIGIDVGWQPLGGLDLAFSESEAEDLRQRLEEHRQRGARAEWLDAAALRASEPAVAPDALGGVLSADDHRVNTVRLAEALAKAAQRRGAQLRYGVTVSALEPQAEGVGCCLTDSGGTRPAHFDAAVLAAGAWSGSVAADTAVRLPLRPVRGQSCHFAGPSVRHILCWSGFHALPADGELLVGGTVEDAGFDVEPTAAAREALGTWCERVLPGTGACVSQRVGVRPKPRQGRPYIGPLMGADSMLAATGHYKSGVLMAPLTGAVVARWLLEGEPGRDMSRFAIRR